jgi:hypothetical protein
MKLDYVNVGGDANIGSERDFGDFLDFLDFLDFWDLRDTRPFK